MFKYVIFIPKKLFKWEVGECFHLFVCLFHYLLVFKNREIEFVLFFILLRSERSAEKDNTVNKFSSEASETLENTRKAMLTFDL